MYRWPNISEFSYIQKLEVFKKFKIFSREVIVLKLLLTIWYFIIYIMVPYHKPYSPYHEHISGFAFNKQIELHWKVEMTDSDLFKLRPIKIWLKTHFRNQCKISGVLGVTTFLVQKFNESKWIILNWELVIDCIIVQILATAILIMGTIFCVRFASAN